MTNACRICNQRPGLPPNTCSFLKINLFLFGTPKLLDCPKFDLKNSINKLSIAGEHRCGTFTMVNILDGDKSSLLDRTSPLQCSILDSSSSFVVVKNVTIVPLLNYNSYCRIKTYGFFCPIEREPDGVFVFIYYLFLFTKNR